MTSATLSRIRPAYAVHRPSEVLHDPELIGSVVAFDTETTGLFVDDGDRMCVLSASYRLKSSPDQIIEWAFPFDQGRAADKGFEVQRLKSGALRGGLEGTIDLAEWEADVNLPRSEWDYAMDWLERVGEACGLTAHNSKFDVLHCAAGNRLGWPGRWLNEFVVWDSQLVQSILDPLELTALKPTATRLWGAQEADEAAEVREALAAAKKLYGLRAEHGPRYDLIPWSIIGPYAAQDTTLGLRLCEYQVDRLEDGDGHGSWRKVSQQNDLGRVLARVERRGFGPFDLERASKIAAFLEVRIAELEPQFPFQPPTPAKASAYFFDELGLRPWKPGDEPRGWKITGGRGAPRVVPGTAADGPRVKATLRGAEKAQFQQGSLGVKVSLRMAAEGVPFAAEYAEYRRLVTANQMHYRGYVDLAGQDQQLRTTFRQAFVKSGRMSVERFQAQALPKGLHLEVRYGDGPDEVKKIPEPRSLFGVAEGRTRLNLDLSQAELRIASMLAECHSMSTALAAGADVHGQTTERVFGIKPEHPDWKAKRDVAKRLNFGGIFMIGAKTFQANLMKQGDIEWPLRDCKEAVDGFRGTYPEYELAYIRWQRFVENKGYVLLYNGERSWFSSRDWPRTAWNRVVQSSLASWVADWLILVEEMTCQYDALTLTVHDSVILDLPVEVAEQVAADVVAASEELWLDAFKVPGRIDVDTWSY